MHKATAKRALPSSPNGQMPFGSAAATWCCATATTPVSVPGRWATSAATASALSKPTTVSKPSTPHVPSCTNAPYWIATQTSWPRCICPKNIWNATLRENYRHHPRVLTSSPSIATPWATAAAACRTIGTLSGNTLACKAVSFGIGATKASLCKARRSKATCAHCWPVRTIPIKNKTKATPGKPSAATSAHCPA